LRVADQTKLLLGISEGFPMREILDLVIDEYSGRGFTGAEDEIMALCEWNWAIMDARLAIICAATTTIARQQLRDIIDRTNLEEK